MRMQSEPDDGPWAAVSSGCDLREVEMVTGYIGLSVHYHPRDPSHLSYFKPKTLICSIPFLQMSSSEQSIGQVLLSLASVLFHFSVGYTKGEDMLLTHEGQV